jgi:glutamate dehydrogenase
MGTSVPKTKIQAAPKSAANTAKNQFCQQAAKLDIKSLSADALATMAAIYFDNINAEDWQQHRPALFQDLFAQMAANLAKFKGTKPRIAMAPVAWHGQTMTSISVVCVDRPFLVDSMTNALHRFGLELELVIYPIASVSKAKADGGWDIAPAKTLHAVKGGAPAQVLSLTQFLVRTPQPGWSTDEVETALHDTLADVELAVDDWQKMRGQLQTVLAELALAPHADAAETAAFLQWLDADHFTFLGYRAYSYPQAGTHGRIQHVSGSGLGVIKDGERRVFGNLRDRDADAPELRQFWQNGDLLSLSKSSAPATVHRDVPMDVISVKRFDAKGRVSGEHRFVGLFTSLSYTRNPRDIPILRRKLEWVVAQTGWNPSGHKAKILIDVLTSFPRDELFQLAQAELLPTALGIARIQEKLRTALFLRRDKFGRFYSALIYTPREGFSSGLREKFGQILLQALGGSIRSFYTQISDQPLARIHFIIDGDAELAAFDDAAGLEKSLAEAARSWDDRLREALARQHGATALGELWRRYAKAFGTQYQNIREPQAAVLDIQALEELRFGKGATPQSHIRVESGSITLYQREQQLALSDMLPSLENLGLRVLYETALPVTLTEDAKPVTIWLHTLAVRRQDAPERGLDGIESVIAEALIGLRRGAVEDDGFNRLVPALGIAAAEVVVFRAYAQYLHQIGFSVSLQNMQRVLAAYPAISRHLLELFYAQFDPARADAMRAAKLQADILMKLDQITLAEDDRILRRYLNLIQATLRTNFFQTDAGGARKKYLALKFDCGQIVDMPKPLLWREIFITSPEFEAVHLRGGKVARGGIRWSDRRDDYRTEILGLVKAQMVKNTVIVPVGSKGGFVLKRSPADPAAYAAHGVACYQTMLRGLLDLTDNWRLGKIIPPAQTIRRDDDDAYLVVAADKGTAKFSDYANAVSAEYGFWLGDAFASGGSAGYDHKELAITARGGWVAVERHFRELGRDIARENFTAIGVGDMAGDVFGNGMLRSDKMRLLAAFNHKHIFIDPNPDPAKSFKERQRLFDNPRLTWADYDAGKLSKGGAVYTRDLKKITLSAEAMRALGAVRAEFTPSELIQQILRSEVDLLWLGGIGTFVKASAENNLDAGDRANDALRIDGRELRAKIVGEGANLGFTQRGRIEYALGGGRINTDAIDNSGGVDTSDHEVNIKILLAAVEKTGQLTRPARDKLLRGMNDDVCALVLRDNYEQTMVLSLLQAEIGGRMDEYAQLLRVLEKTVKLNRKIEFLPGDQEWVERVRAQQPLTRPELAVILAYAKMGLYESLLASNVPDDPALMPDLLAYFPPALAKKYPDAIAKHKLRREIISTVLTNQLINRLGVLLPYQLAELAGVELADVVRAYVTMRETYGFEEIWQDVCALDGKVKAEVQTHLALALHRFAERSMLWFLRQPHYHKPLRTVLDLYATPIRAIEARGMELITATDQKILSGKIETFVRQGVPKNLAEVVVLSRMLGSAGDIVNIAQKLDQAPVAVAALYYRIGEQFGLDWMRRVCAKLPRGSAWQVRATSSLIDDLLGLQARLTKEVARRTGTKPESLAKWLAAHPHALVPVQTMLAELHAAPAVDTAMITVAVAKIRMLLV